MHLLSVSLSCGEHLFAKGLYIHCCAKVRNPDFPASQEYLGKLGSQPSQAFSASFYVLPASQIPKNPWDFKPCVVLVAYALDLVGRRSEQQLEVKCA